MAAQLTWGEIKDFMERNGVPDTANINLEVETKGFTPQLTANGWANGMSYTGPYTVTLRHN